MSKKKSDQKEQPYSNMFARRLVLILGAAIILAGFIAVLLGALVFFVPGFEVIKGTRPLIQIIYLLAAGLIACFIGIVFAVAGANTMKGIARLSFFIGSVSFIIGAALLIVALFFKTFIPNYFVEGGEQAAEMFSMLI